MRTLITVPMKNPRASKTRLRGALSDPARDRLVRLLYRRTLEFLGPVAGNHGAALAVVTGDTVAADMARTAGFAVIEEPRDTDLSGALTAAGHWAVDRGYDRLCIIPADLAAPLATDMDRLLSSEAAVTVCPSVDRGTNALLLSPPDAIRFRYGPASALRHLEEAQAKGLTAVLLPLDSLSFDIDTSACLTRAMDVVPELQQACS